MRTTNATATSAKNSTVNLKLPALSYAKRGWPVFPVKAGEKTPLVKEWQKRATTDPKQIEEWWTAWPDANIGFHVGAAGMIALDYDEGSDAEACANKYGLPLTRLVSRTPSGGDHEFYTLPADARPTTSASKLASKVDTRAHGGYVLLPPSRTAKGSYEWIEQGTPSPIPQSVLDALGAKKDRAHADDPSKVNVEPDRPENIAAYGAWLATAANGAKEGERNTVLAATAAMGRSYALTAQATLAVLRERYADKLEPPLDDDEFERTVFSAHGSASSPQGNLTGEYRDKRATAVFQDRRSQSPLLDAMLAALGGTGADLPPIPLYDLDALATLPPPEWDIASLIGRASVGEIVGAWGHYKTFVALDIGVALAAGDAWPVAAEEKTKRYSVPDARRVLYLAAEGGASEYKERLASALEIRKGVDRKRVRHNFRLATASAPIDTLAGIRALADVVARATTDLGGAPEVIVFDTLAKSMAGEENSNSDMARVQRVAAAMQRALGCTVIFVHHVNKGGDLSGRGGSAMPAGVDFILSVVGDDKALTATVNVEKQKNAPAERNIVLQGRVVGGSLAFTRVAVDQNRPKVSATLPLIRELEAILSDGGRYTTQGLARRMAERGDPKFEKLPSAFQNIAVEKLRGEIRRKLIEAKTPEANDFRERFRFGTGASATWCDKERPVPVFVDGPRAHDRRTNP